MYRFECGARIANPRYRGAVVNKVLPGTGKEASPIIKNAVKATNEIIKNQAGKTVESASEEIRK